MELIMAAITSIRNIRSEMNVVPSKKAKVLVLGNEYEVIDSIKEGTKFFISLASTSEIQIIEDKNEIPNDAVSVVIEGAELFIPLDELIDFEKEIERLNKEKSKLESEIKRVEGKLSNEGFVKKAPAHLIEEEKNKKVKFTDMLDKVIERIERIK